MITIKVSFDRHLLPRRFSWLRHHTCIISATDKAIALHHAFGRLIEAIEQSQPSFEEIPGIIDARCAEVLDYTASIFDVLGIDVTAARAAG